MIRILALAATLAVALAVVGTVLSVGGDDSVLVPPPEEVAVSFVKQLDAGRLSFTMARRDRLWKIAELPRMR